MEAMLGIGLGYVVILSPALIVFIVVSARHKGVEKRLDALVQMARISGQVVATEEISQPLRHAGSPRSGQRWGIVLTVTAVGVAVAGMLVSEEGIIALAIALAGLGIGLILAQVWFDRIADDSPKVAI
jgi:hypothetical protein